MLLFQDTYKISKTALEPEEDGNTEAAFTGWEHLFPDYFPTSIDMKIGRIRSMGILRS